MPLTLLTGFLGSGKTTILRRILQGTQRRIAILVNEVADLGIDQHLLQEIDEDVLLLAGGCVCCSIRGDLHAAWERVTALEPDHIVLETTGLADPAPILHALANDPNMSTGLELAGVAVVVDALRAEDLLASHREFRQQLDFADRILVTKTDLATERLDSLRQLLDVEAAGVDRREVLHGELDEAWFLGQRRFAGRSGKSQHEAWLAGTETSQLRLSRLADRDRPSGESAHASFRTHALHHDRPVHLPGLELWFRLVTQIDGPRLLRIKAVVRSADDDACYVLQSANRTVAPLQVLNPSPADLVGAKIVIIERGMPPRAMTALLESLSSALESVPC